MATTRPLCVNTEGGARGRPRWASHIWALLLLSPLWTCLKSHLHLPRRSYSCRKQGTCDTCNQVRGSPGEPHTGSTGWPPPGLWDGQTWTEDSCQTHQEPISEAGERHGEGSQENLWKTHIYRPHVGSPTESETRWGVVTSPPGGPELLGRGKEQWERPPSLGLRDGETEG